MLRKRSETAGAAPRVLAPRALPEACRVPISGARVRASTRASGAIRRLAGLSLLAAAVGCAGSSPVPPPAATGSEPETYVIGVRDVLKISVWEDPGLAGQVVVRTDGMISIPLLDDIRAEGLAPQQLKQAITEALSEYVTDPDVTVVVMAMNSQTVSVLGGVVQSGEVPLRGRTRVLQAIARSGGFSRGAKKSKVKILRQTPTGLVEYRFDYDAYLAGRAPESNLVLRAGDTIVVPD